MENSSRPLLKSKYLFFLVSVLFLASSFQGCKKEVDTELIDFGYDYFPIDVGTYRIYLVDSIGHDITSDTSQFQIMERVVESFSDNIGQPSYRIERMKRLTSNSPWTFQTSFVVKKTTTSATQIEENQRYIRMVFPVKEDQEWDGNAYNPMDPWIYTYSSIGTSRNFGLYNFPNTVTVNQRNNVNLVDQEIAREIYAEDIGLVYKQLIDLNIQQEGLFGIEMEMSILAYGVQ